MMLERELYNFFISNLRKLFYHLNRFRMSISTLRKMNVRYYHIENNHFQQRVMQSDINQDSLL